MATELRPNQEMFVSEPGPLPKELWPSVEHLVTEDDRPVDNIFSEKQQRMLTEPLYTSWTTELPFLALSNVGLFYSTRVPPYVPDALLSLNVRAPENLFPKSNRSYFVWEYGKPPDVVVEIVSNREGNEDGDKLIGYARIGIPFYIIYDPGEFLRTEKLRFYELRGGQYELVEGSTHAMPSIGLGVTVWSGSFEGHSDNWLRWTDLSGELIPTGSERACAEKDRADAEAARAATEAARAETEAARAEKEAARAESETARANTEAERADTQAARADREKERAEAELQRSRLLIEQLKRLGIEPESL